MYEVFDCICRIVNKFCDETKMIDARSCLPRLRRASRGRFVLRGTLFNVVRIALSDVLLSATLWKHRVVQRCTSKRMILESSTSHVVVA